jgi:pyruvate/2-oxoglutarate dehydrogenase complex dihydrolipoamide dehydrogenase (E3) component
MANEFERKQRVAILGGGPGGYEAALAAAQLGSEVFLIERSGIGGSAVLTDVVPSKTLIATAEFTTTLERATDLGVRFFTTGGEGTPQKPTVDTIIVSVGASPRILDTAKPDGKRIFTWNQLYTLAEIPEHLIVVGSGVTGAEFASAYRALGAKVTLVSSRDQVLPGEDADAATLLQNVFERRGMTLKMKARAESAVATESGVTVTLGDGEKIEGSHCLIAVGSIPNTAGIGLEEAGVELTETGHIRVNRVARSSAPNIYGVGDCSNVMPLASVAMMQGRTAAFHALGDAVDPFEERNVASNIFTQPEIATVGWSQAEIESGLIRGTIHKLELSANPRAKMQGISEGFVKLITTTTSRTVIGGVIVAPRASELIFALALAVEHRLTVDDVARAFAVYPSISGSIVDAARALHKVAIE